MHERLTKLSSCPIKISPALVKGILATWFPQLLFWFSLSPESSQHLPTGLLFLPHVPHPDGKDEIPSMQICLQPSPVTQLWCHDLQNKDQTAEGSHGLPSRPPPLPFECTSPASLLEFPKCTSQHQAFISSLICSSACLRRNSSSSVRIRSSLCPDHSPSAPGSRLSLVYNVIPCYFVMICSHFSQ